MNTTSEDEATVRCTAFNARRIDSKTLYALVDVELVVAGAAFVICGVQARRVAGSSGTSIHLPTYKGLDGCWHTAIELPPELREPMAAAVLDLLMAEGLSKARFGPSSVANG